MDINLLVQQVIALIMLASVILIYRTIKSNEKLNQNLLFNEAVKQERELRIKLQEYREEIHSRIDESLEPKEITLDYDSLLFNYYEYLAICVYKQIIDGNDAAKYFKESLKSVRQQFDDSILFREGYAEKSQYPGLRWLFEHWKISKNNGEN